MPKKKLALAKLDVSKKALVRGDSFRTTTVFVAGDLKIDETGMKVGDYGAENIPYENLEEIRTLGSGASSTVKLARDKISGKMYALKCIAMFDKGMRDMFKQEIYSLYKGQCASLISFHGAIYREGWVAVILEYMDLGGLDEVVKLAGPMPESVLAAVTFQVLFGLGYLQFEKRLHRDIKPQNILISRSGHVKLTDFGISREIETYMKAKTFVGSFKYMSPERMAHDRYDYRSDIWSLGLVLIEIGTGQYPYPKADAVIEYVTLVTDGDSPTLPPDSEGRTYTPQFRDFISKCCAKDPDDRLSARELLEHEWLDMHDAITHELCREIIQEYFVEKGILNETTPEGGGGGGQEA